MPKFGEMTDERLAEIRQLMAIWTRERLEVKIESHIVGEIFESLLARLDKVETENAKLREVAEIGRCACATLIREPLLHGDEKHREWLRKYLEAHFAEFAKALDAWKGETR